MTLHLIPLNILIYEENLIFFFISVVCREQEGPQGSKAVKALLSLVSRQVPDLGFFEKPKSLQDTGRRLC